MWEVLTMTVLDYRIGLQSENLEIAGLSIAVNADTRRVTISRMNRKARRTVLAEEPIPSGLWERCFQVPLEDIDMCNNGQDFLLLRCTVYGKRITVFKLDSNCELELRIDGKASNIPFPFHFAHEMTMSLR